MLTFAVSELGCVGLWWYGTALYFPSLRWLWNPYKSFRTWWWVTPTFKTGRVEVPYTNSDITTTITNETMTIFGRTLMGGGMVVLWI